MTAPYGYGAATMGQPPQPTGPTAGWDQQTAFARQAQERSSYLAAALQQIEQSLEAHQQARDMEYEQARQQFAAWQAAQQDAVAAKQQEVQAYGEWVTGNRALVPNQPGTLPAATYTPPPQADAGATPQQPLPRAPWEQGGQGMNGIPRFAEGGKVLPRFAAGGRFIATMQGTGWVIIDTQSGRVVSVVYGDMASAQAAADRLNGGGGQSSLNENSGNMGGPAMPAPGPPVPPSSPRTGYVEGSPSGWRVWNGTAWETFPSQQAAMNRSSQLLTSSGATGVVNNRPAPTPAAVPTPATRPQAGGGAPQAAASAPAAAAAPPPPPPTTHVGVGVQRAAAVPSAQQPGAAGTNTFEQNGWTVVQHNGYHSVYDRNGAFVGTFKDDNALSPIGQPGAQSAAPAGPPMPPAMPGAQRPGAAGTNTFEQNGWKVVQHDGGFHSVYDMNGAYVGTFPDGNANSPIGQAGGGGGQPGGSAPAAAGPPMPPGQGQAPAPAPAAPQMDPGYLAAVKAFEEQKKKEQEQNERMFATQDAMRSERGTGTPRYAGGGKFGQKDEAVPPWFGMNPLERIAWMNNYGPGAGFLPGAAVPQYQKTFAHGGMMDDEHHMMPDGSMMAGPPMPPGPESEVVDPTAIMGEGRQSGIPGYRAEIRIKARAIANGDVTFVDEPKGVAAEPGDVIIPMPSAFMEDVAKEAFPEEPGVPAFKKGGKWMAAPAGPPMPPTKKKAAVKGKK